MVAVIWLEWFPGDRGSFLSATPTQLLQTRRNRSITTIKTDADTMLSESTAHQRGSDRSLFERLPPPRLAECCTLLMASSHWSRCLWGWEFPPSVYIPNRNSSGLCNSVIKFARWGPNGRGASLHSALSAANIKTLACFCAPQCLVSVSVRPSF